MCVHTIKESLARETNPFSDNVLIIRPEPLKLPNWMEFDFALRKLPLKSAGHRSPCPNPNAVLINSHSKVYIYIYNCTRKPIDMRIQILGNSVVCMPFALQTKLSQTQMQTQGGESVIINSTLAHVKTFQVFNVFFSFCEASVF